MSKHKYTTAICIAIVAVMLITTVVFMASSSLGMEIVHNEPAYVGSLFSTDRVHTIDIVVKESDWDGMLANALAEEYIQCTVVIDGKSVKGVGIRPKGNSSLSMIASSDLDRYSFKVEFDHYEKGKSYFGLDKLALNNIAQDNTYMKDYVSYQMMNAMGADAPLSSFIWVTVNGEDWGLYLAAEGVEDAFAQRVYGNQYDQIYKPDSMNMGDRQGNNGGEGGFGGGATSLIYSDDNPDSYSAIFDNTAFKPSKADKNRLIASLKQLNEGENIEQVVDVDEVIRYFVVHNFVLNSDSYTGSMTHNYYLAENDGKLSMIAWDYNLAFGGMGGFGMGGGMGRMPGGEDANNAQTETNGSTDNATSMVNYPIDSPMLAGSTDDKPMIAWIFKNDEYLDKYHEVFAEYMEYFSAGKFAEMYDNAIALISPYVQKDPSAFCTYEEFLKGSATLREFCLLRAESITGQLNGTIAATSDRQTASGNAGFINASSIDIESMGSNSMGFGGARGGQFRGWNGGNEENPEPAANSGNEVPTGTGGDDNFRPQNGQGEPNADNVTPPQGGFPGNNNAAGRDMQNADAQNPQNNGGSAFPNMDTRSVGASATSNVSKNEVILLFICVAVLIGGIVFAKKEWA